MSKVGQKIISAYKKEKSFLIIKPDGVKRGLIGAILTHFEKKVIKVVAMKMIMATEAQIRAHYPMEDEEWLTRLGGKSLSSFDGLDLDPKEVLWTTDTLKIGKSVAESLVGYMMSGPCVIMILEGIQAVNMVRKIVWHTLPSKADVGSIRADFSIDTPLVANFEWRAIHNLVHASEVLEEANKEIDVWFGRDPEIFDYKRAEELIAYSKCY